MAKKLTGPIKNSKYQVVHVFLEKSLIHILVPENFRPSDQAKNDMNQLPIY